jgi:protein-tyrosine phosphatase
MNGTLNQGDLLMRVRVHAFISAIAVALTACAAAPVKSTAPVPDSAINAPRLITLEGAQNLRDIGGYRTVDGRRVKWGMIYRSADLSKLTASDLAALNDLNVHTVFDLRSTSERHSAPDAFTGHSATVSLDYSIDTHNVVAALSSAPTAESVRKAMATMYPVLLNTLQPEFRQLFTELLEGPAATLYHCTAGKDRTGLATALILSALGVPRETIYADYLMSNRFYHPANAPAMGGLSPELAATLKAVDESYLRAAFDAIDAQYGSVDGYLDRALGVDAAKIARLRTIYTE